MRYHRAPLQPHTGVMPWLDPSADPDVHFQSSVSVAAGQYSPTAIDELIGGVRFHCALRQTPHREA
ncbi:hypothetical protein CBOM_07653 [Ceraceosorus bombacis]|uniref:Uncharacterized protein n=1 Tax=Ceraceosorus bombacis TaxID=401625 RepID=A0A0P1BNC2_9BASI|nr:hypothetical protein CBOM_07653 [Ceraceosorus bombacis]